MEAASHIVMHNIQVGHSALYQRTTQGRTAFIIPEPRSLQQRVPECDAPIQNGIPTYPVVDNELA